MKIRYTELRSGAEQRAGELTTQEYLVDELILGRGGKSHILLADRSVSLEHASIKQREDGRIVVKDLGSLSGLRVNGQIQKEIVLSSGDIVSIGNLDFKILKDSDSWVVVHEKSETDLKKEQSTSQEPLSLSHYVPSNAKLSALVVFILLFVYGVRTFIYPVDLENYSVGKLTPHHVFIGKDCSACHTQAFQPASDEGCKSCHNVTSHFKNTPTNNEPFFHGKSDGTTACIECHTEHKGQVTFTKDAVCTTCHAQIESVQDAKLKNVHSWNTHPEFDLPVDKGTIALNHAVHLKKGLRGDKGTETLTCQSCHTMDPRGEKMLPVNYETNCARCHSLEFDERLLGVKAPHDDPAVVISSLERTYAELALHGGNVITKGDTERLRKTTKIDAPKFTQESVKGLVREAEDLLFTKTGCVLCHQIDTISSVREVKRGESRFAVKNSSVIETWLPKSVFSHRSHGHMTCESCHGEVNRSELSSDVLMPKRINCIECHQSAEDLSNCVTCHSYHDTLPFVHKENKRISP